MSKQTTASPAANKPVHTVRHRNLRATIWRNQTKNGYMYNVTISRSYLEGEEWRDSSSFGYDDLTHVAKLMYDAHSFISSQKAKDAEAEPRQRQNSRQTP